MNPDTGNLLAQLRDIHGAPPAAWWPPAPGWWVLAALLLVALAVLARRLALARRRRLRRQRLLDHLDALHRRFDPADRPGDFLAAVNGLLKLVALRAFPGQGCAPLRGPEWVAFLAGSLPDPRGGEALAALAEGPWMAAPRFDGAALLDAARAWISRHG